MPAQKSGPPPAPGRVSVPPFSPPRGKPFVGLTGAPAANTKIPNLTEHVAIAKVKRDAIKNGGLITPAQRKAASDAGKALAAHKAVKQAATKIPNKPPPPPPPPKQTPRIPPAMLPASAKTAAQFPRGLAPHVLGAPPAPAPGTPSPSPPGAGAPTGYHLAPGATDNYTPNAPTQDPTKVGFFMSKQPAGTYGQGTPSVAHAVTSAIFNNPIANAASYGLGTALSGAATIPSVLTTPMRLGATHTAAEDIRPTTLPKATQKIAVGANTLAGGISNVGLHLPTTIPSTDLVGTAKAAGKSYTPQQLVAAGLQTPAQDKAFRAMALKRGWTSTELDPLVGLDLIQHAYSSPPPEPLRTLQNGASGVVRSAGLVNVLPAAVAEIGSGHGSRFATQLAGSLTSRLPVVGQHPWGEMALGDPYNTLPAAAGGLKTLGGIGGKALEMTGARTLADRNVTLAGSNVTVNRGPQARNLYDASIQSVKDAAAHRIPAVGNHVLARNLDKIYIDNTNAIAPGHFAAARTYAQARKPIGNERAVIIMKAQEAGAFHHDGTISRQHLVSQLHDWLQKAEKDGPNSPAAGQAKFFSEKVIPALVDADHARAIREDAIRGRVAANPVAGGQSIAAIKSTKVTPEDIAFAKAHADLAAHNTESRSGQGNGFDSTAAQYRAHERLLTAAARQGDLNPALGNDPLAVKVLQLRKAYQASTDSPAGQALGREGGKLAEATRLANHADAQVAQLQKTAGAGRTNPALEAAQAQANDLHARVAELSGRASDKSAAAFEAQHENIKQAYQQAVQEFADQHANEGGAAPVRSEYVNPPSSTGYVPPASRTGGSKFNDNPQRANVKASTGFMADTGRYLTDSQSPLRESMKAQHLAISANSARQVFHELGHEVPQGTSIPKGWVFVPEHNAATAGKLINDLHDNPVNADEYTQQAHARQSLLDHLTGNAQTEGEVTATNGHLLPKAVFKRIQDYSKPESRSVFQRTMSQYQRWLIGTFPSTLVGNTVGTGFFGAAGGAGPHDYAAAKQWPDEATPFTTHSGTVSGRLQAQGTNAATRFNQWMLGKSRSGEALTAKALWISKMGGVKGMTKRSAELGYNSVLDYAKDVSLGKVDKAKQDAALEWVTKFVGKSIEPDGRIGRGLGKAIMFHQWVEHVAKFMLYTLPVEHPRRLALINALANYGDAYRKQHGVWPNYMQAFFPLFAERMGLNKVTTALNLGQFAPQSTAGGAASALFDNTQPWYQRALSVAAPWYSIPGNVAVQSIQNRGSYKPVSIPWYLAHEVASAIPGETKFAPNAGRGKEYVPFIHDTKTTSSYVNSDGKTVKIPIGQRSGGRPLGADSPFWSPAGLLGIASRVAGVPIEQTPTTGQAQGRDITTTKHYAVKADQAGKPKRPY